MGLTVLVVNGDRHLINEDSITSDKVCVGIIENYPSDAVVEFSRPKLTDVKRRTLKDLINGRK